MKLSQLLEGVAVSKLFQTMFGRMVVTHEVEVHAVQYDSRNIQRGDCFVAIRGTGFDGHRFAQEAIARGARVIVVEDDQVVPDSLCMHQGVVKVVVQNSRKALALLAGNFYGRPAEKLRVIGVTGTNGKTTTTHIIRSILEASGETVGLIGTIEYRIGSRAVPASHTTPESLELNHLLSQMVEQGCTSVSMEVSSHALHQARVHGISFQAAIFTNLTQDHLDYHGSMDEYFRAKKILFDYANTRDPEDHEDLRCDLPALLQDKLLSADRDFFDVVAFTHLDEDHYKGATEFFWLDHARRYQGGDRIKINTLWVPAAVITETSLDKHEARILQKEARHRFKEGTGIRVFSRPDRLRKWCEENGVDDVG